MPLAKKEQMVLEALQASEAPLKAYQLLERLRGDEFTAPTQIYRTLEKLLASGRIHRLETLNAYTACARGKCCTEIPAAFMICKECGAIEELINHDLLIELKRLTRRHDFLLQGATLELHGLCFCCTSTDRADRA